MQRFIIDELGGIPIEVLFHADKLLTDTIILSPNSPKDYTGLEEKHKPMPTSIFCRILLDKYSEKFCAAIFDENNEDFFDQHKQSSAYLTSKNKAIQLKSPHSNTITVFVEYLNKIFADQYNIIGDFIGFVINEKIAPIVTFMIIQ